MTFLIAAAGTGGHVFPGLAVGEALLESGVAASEVLYVGGDRVESSVYPEAGFPFLAVEVRGLERSLTVRNLALARIMWRARDAVGAAIEERRVRVVLGMGGYVTVPAALAARSKGVALFIAEQNAGAGLANRVAARWARRVFLSFPETEGLTGEWVGNPVRRSLAGFDRESLVGEARARYRLDPDLPTLGVVGGSLGAGALNRATTGLVASWSGPPVQVVHLTGRGNRVDGEEAPGVEWRRVEFEERMELFYAACDLVVARSGGGVAELTATATPSVLVPGHFGSGGHQAANARLLQSVGAARVVEEGDLGTLPRVVADLLFDRSALAGMAVAARSIAKPEAAMTIARAMSEARG